MSDPRQELLSLVTARVRDAYVRKPYTVDGGTDLVSLCRQLAERGLTHALVQDGERLGIFTTTDLRDALLRPEPPAALAVREVARFPVLDVQADAEVFEALWLMVKHRVHRLLVRDGERIVGLLGQLDLVSFVANHSHLAALQIDDAASVEELRAAALQIDRMIALFAASGVHVERIAHLVGELHARLFQRLWALVAPAELVANSCLLVMGSEGRGEQVLKTDQDNALILRDGFEHPETEAAAQRFSAALADFGYPPCPGEIMVTNPLWRRPVAAWREQLREWVMGHDADGPMRLAIFCDAVAVAGDAALLDGLVEHLGRLFGDHDAYLARFAAAAEQFQEPHHWLGWLPGRREDQALDLKKQGLFPIVQGVRALALQHHVRATGTVARLQALVAAGGLDAALARDLQDALHLLMTLRLQHQLQALAAGQPAGNEVQPAALGLLEREPLRDSLAVVKRLRAFLRQHFRYDKL
ncbi:signal transduction protein [Rubrivivax gelatinosus]|nr:signal transduction protein [Rubrivivax gelatinosus]